MQSDLYEQKSFYIKLGSCKAKIVGFLLQRFSWLYQCSVEGPFPETHKTVMKAKYALFKQNCLWKVI